jgi:ketosteroid isomerase-like protein
MTTVDRELHLLAAETRREFLANAVRELYDLRAEGDLEGMLRRCAPDCVYRTYGEWTRPPYFPVASDRETFAEALRQVNVEFEDLGCDIHELLVEGDRVAVHRTVRLRNRGAGGVVKVDTWDCFRLRDGLVIEYACYVDCAKLGRLESAAVGGAR